MSYHSDPTANMAIGSVSREFTRLEKKAKKLRDLLDEGKITWDDIEKAQSQFNGIYRHVLDNVLRDNT